MKPIVKKVGSATVKIYFAPVKSAGKKYDSFLVRYYFDGKTQQKRFSDFKEADQFAEDTAQTIASGQIAARHFDETKKQAFHKAETFLEPTGKPVEIAAHEYAEAFNLLGGISVLEAAKFYRRMHPEGFIKKSIQDVAEEMYSAKKSDGLSKDWIRALKSRIKKLIAKFGAQTPLVELNGVEVNDWLRGLKLAPKTRNHYRSAIIALVSFAKSKKYLPKDFSEMDYIPVVEETGGDIQIYTPDELVKLLNSSRGALHRFIAFGAFAGLRSSEIARLEWPQVSEHGIEIKAFQKGKRIAKTAARRIVPLLPPLAEIISNRPKTGKVWSAKKEYPQTTTTDYLTQRSGVEWKHNALRHSFISYRLAIVKNTAQVALECGTSERKIFTNYRQLVTEKAAEEWFEIYKSVTKKLAFANDKLRSSNTVLNKMRLEH